MIGVFPATDEAARRGFGWGGNLIDCVDDPTVVYEISSDGDEGDTQSLASTVDGAYGESWHDYYDEGGDAMYEQTPMHHDTVESVVIPDEVAMSVPLEPVYNVRGELLQAGRQPELPTLIHMADVGHTAARAGSSVARGRGVCDCAAPALVPPLSGRLWPTRRSSNRSSPGWTWRPARRY